MSVMLTDANWRNGVTVTVTGVDDGTMGRSVPYSIVTDQAASADPSYKGQDPADVSCVNTLP
jgi:hypothetical protein